MSLRARLVPVLAAVLLGPVLVGSLAVGVIVPRVAGAANAAAAGRNADAAAAALAGYCLQAGDIAQAAARELGASVRAGVPVTAAAGRAVERAGARLPGVVLVAVLDTADRVVAGPGAGTTAAASAAARRSSCAQGRPAPSGPPVLAAAVDISLTGRPGRLVAWRTLDDAALRTLASGLQLSGSVTLLGPAPRAGGTAAVRLAGTEPADAFTPLADALSRGETAGRAGGARGAVRFKVRPAAPGQPYPLVATAPDRGIALLPWLAALLGLALALGALVVRVLTRTADGPRPWGAPVWIRLPGGPGGEWDGPASQRLSEALGRTHDLDGLLETVTGAAADAGEALTGVVLLGDPVQVGDPMPVGGVAGLAERYRMPPPQAWLQPPGKHRGKPDPRDPDFVRPEPAVLDLASVEAAADELAGFAAVATRAAATGGATYSVDALPDAGPVVVLPLRDGEGVLGALALARGPGGSPFEPDAVERLDRLARQAATAIANARLHEEARRLSVTDPLTGTGNVRQLSTTLSREVERATRFGRPLSVLMLDLDKFKDVNDEHGHAVGDAVLRECAQRLTNCLREVDTVARYGGEEFTVILPETDSTGASRVAERILTVIREGEFRIGEVGLWITVSAGVASFPVHGRTATDLLRAADTALYAAKAAGRDRWCLAGISRGSAPAPQAG